MTSTRKLARTIGLLYLLVSIPGIWGLIYVPTKLIVRGDAAATARNILASPTLFRSGVVADLLGQAAFVLIAVLLYRMLSGVDRTLAILMLVLLAAQVPIVFAAEVHRLAALRILDPAGPLAALGEAQRNAQLMLSLNSYHDAILADEILMGVWLFPLAALIWKSEFIPRFVGVLLWIAGFAYLIEAVAWLFAPEWGPPVTRVAEPVRSVELVMPLWFLIFGAKDRPLPE